MVAIPAVSGPVTAPGATSAPSAAVPDAPVHAAAFTQEVRAAQPSPAQALGRDLADRLQGLSERLRGWSAPVAGGDKAGPAAGAPQVGQLQAGDAVAQLQAVYTFAIETTLASRGSTETTKIFNTLLKGQ